jgi:hypothetical protein
MATKAEKRAAVVASMKAMKTKPLGEGSRFRAVEKSARLSGARDPGAVAYSIGVKKYGKEKMAALSKGGRNK